ncbi:MAG TPA: hypothetical protein PKW48_14375, partial [Deltaproteobacteria bacterium]|nr:hypothetical protein [Deltaproteobacteria bacterium]
EAEDAGTSAAALRSNLFLLYREAVRSIMRFHNVHMDSISENIIGSLRRSASSSSVFSKSLFPVENRG